MAYMRMIDTTIHTMLLCCVAAPQSPRARKMRDNLKRENSMGSGGDEDKTTDNGSAEPSGPAGTAAAQPPPPASAPPADTDRLGSLRKAVLEVRHPSLCARVFLTRCNIAWQVSRRGMSRRGRVVEPRG